MSISIINLQPTNILSTHAYDSHMNQEPSLFIRQFVIGIKCE